MAIIKVRGWALTLIKLLVLPSLVKLHAAIDTKAKETPEEWDDVLAGAFKTVIDFLDSPEAFEET